MAERIDSGWNNVNFEGILSKEWCPIEFKNFAFNEDDLQSFVDKNVSHFSRASYGNLLREDYLNGDLMLPFFASVIDDRQLTTMSCLRCINYHQNLNLPKVKICHLCHLLNREPHESNVYA